MKNRIARAAGHSFLSGRLMRTPLLLAMVAGSMLTPLAIAANQPAPDSAEQRAAEAAARAEALARQAAAAAAAAEAARVEALRAQAEAAEARAAAAIAEAERARADAEAARAAAARAGVNLPPARPLPPLPPPPTPLPPMPAQAPAPATPAPAPAPAGPSVFTTPARPAPAPIPENLPPGWYPVTMIDLMYGTDPQPVSLARLRETVVTLGVAFGGGLTGLEERSRSVELRISEIGTGEYNRIDAAGIRVITQTLVREFENSGVIGVAVLPDPDQIEISGPPADLRKAGDTTLRLFAFVGIVNEIRSVAVDQIDPSRNRINPDTRFHNRLRSNAPLRKGDVLDRNKLDEYVARNSRHPGRRVDVSVSASGQEQGGAALDFLVSETYDPWIFKDFKPWIVYFQLSNTGTGETNELRQRFGFLHTNLTDNDDILQVDYTTAGFTDSHAISASYDFPIVDRLRMKVFAGYNYFQASDVGQQLQNFDGQGINLGAEVAWEFAYWQSTFFDLVGGMRYEYSEANRKLPGPDQSGTGNFIVPSIGVRAQRRTDASDFTGSVMLEYYGGVGNDEVDLQDLGRLDPDSDWPMLKFDFGGSFYIEPLLFPTAFNEGQATDGSVLANEFFFNLRGQYAFDNRVIPTVEQTMGGFATVRGYEESLLAGDSAVVLTGEYRLHIPPLLGYAGPEDRGAPGDFRFRPTEPWGSADWDLIFRAFMDVGRVVNSDRKVFEQDETLIGAGLGLELQVLRYLNARVDWGFVLQDIKLPGEDVEVGDNRLHFVVTVSF